MMTALEGWRKGIERGGSALHDQAEIPRKAAFLQETVEPAGSR